MEIFPSSNRNSFTMNASTCYLYNTKGTLDSHLGLGTNTWRIPDSNSGSLWIGWWYCFDIFTESATSDAHDTVCTVSSFGSLGISLDPAQLVLLGEDSVEYNVFVEYTPEYVGNETEELARM